MAVGPTIVKHNTFENVYLTVAVGEVNRFGVKKRKANSLAHIVLIKRVLGFHCVADPIV